MYGREDQASGEAARWTPTAQGINNHRISSSSTMTAPQNIFTNPAIQPSSVINLSNSTDVVIGPMTQYQGPVTIYYMDASMQTAAGINSSNNSNSSSNSSNNDNSNNHNSNSSSSSSSDKRRAKSRRLTRNSLLLSMLVLLVLITAIVIVYVELKRTRGQLPPSNNKSIYFGNTYEDGTCKWSTNLAHHSHIHKSSAVPNLGNGHLVIDRHQWGGSTQGKQLTVPLQLPIPYVLITHIGVQSKTCDNIYKCSIKMRTIQDSAIAEKHLPDIQSNFYVSNDGNIYVGRGWEWANTYANHTLAITFMGDYGRYQPSAKQLEGVQFLLAHAVANHRLDLDYKLVAQNQTKGTKSPGINVYSEISKWPHFYACDMSFICGSELGMTNSSWTANQ